jgi:hypothetical protein
VVIFTLRSIYYQTRIAFLCAKSLIFYHSWALKKNEFEFELSNLFSISFELKLKTQTQYSNSFFLSTQVCLSHVPTWSNFKSGTLVIKSILLYLTQTKILYFKFSIIFWNWIKIWSEKFIEDRMVEVQKWAK